MKIWLCVLMMDSLALASEYQAMLHAVDLARERVIIYVPSIYDIELGNALRRAKLDPVRNVNVQILSIPYYNHQPKSLMCSLAMNHIAIYETQVPSAIGFIIVDGQAWKGKALARYSEAELKVMSQKEIEKNLNWFEDVKVMKSTKVLTQLNAFERLKKIVP